MSYLWLCLIYMLEKLCFGFSDFRTSIYDSRARERRRQIEEQEALAAQLLRQVTAVLSGCSSVILYLTYLCCRWVLAAVWRRPTQHKCGGSCSSSFGEGDSFDSGYRRVLVFGRQARIPTTHRGMITCTLYWVCVCIHVQNQHFENRNTNLQSLKMPITVNLWMQMFCLVYFVRKWRHK